MSSESKRKPYSRLNNIPWRLRVKKIRTKAISERCYHCRRPIIWVYRHRGRRVPIESYSWEGSVYFLPKIHRFHGFKCEFWRKRRPDVAADPDLIVE